MTNDTDATATDNAGTNGAETARAQPSAAGATAAAAKKSDKDPTIPNLKGKYVFIKPLCESQRPSLSKVMATSSVAMFATERDIRNRSETHRRFIEKYIDKHDVDENGKGKEKPFIPHSLRSKQPINLSKQVQNDSRCTTSYGRITTVMEQARQTHEAYKIKMGALMQQVAELEVDGKIEILSHQYCTAVLSIAEGLFIVGKAELQCPTPKLSATNTALAAAHVLFQRMPKNHWEALWFVGDSDEESLEKFYKEFQKTHGYSFATDIRDSIVDADTPLIEWIADKLVASIPILTTSFWEHIAEQEAQRKMDAELEELYKKKEITTANDGLSNAMEVEGEEALDSAIDKRIEKRLNQRTSKNKSKARKNSSGDPKNHGSIPTANGKESSKKSRDKQEKNSRGRRSDHNSDYSDDADYDSRYSQRNSRRRRNDHYNHDFHDDRRHYNRGRSSERGQREDRPHSILRKRSISWGKNATPPPRARFYSDEESPRRSRGSSYHNSRTTQRDGRGRGRGRGGRGRSTNGGRGGGGRSNKK